MIIETIAMAAALTTFHSWYSPEIAETIMNDVVCEESHAYLDYDGDGEESLLDAIGVLKRYYSNLENGNELTFDQTKMGEIAEENGLDVIYWEIDFIEDEACRKYEYSTNEETRIHVYYETEDECDGFWATMSPAMELISVE